MSKLFIVFYWIFNILYNRIYARSVGGVPVAIENHYTKTILLVFVCKKYNVLLMLIFRNVLLPSNPKKVIFSSTFFFVLSLIVTPFFLSKRKIEIINNLGPLMYRKDSMLSFPPQEHPLSISVFASELFRVSRQFWTLFGIPKGTWKYLVFSSETKLQVLQILLYCTAIANKSETKWYLRENFHLLSVRAGKIRVLEYSIKNT